MDRYLSSGYELKLNNQIYTIISLIGRGATCAVYTAKSDEQKYIIKEYCPSYIPFSRDENATVIVDESYRQKYYDGLNAFVAAYQKQKELRSIKGIANSTPFANKIFEANNTKYFIVVPYEGATYKEKAGSLSIKERICVCRTLANLACKYHEAGYLLLDIKPDNFFVIDETCELIEYIDFDSIKTKDELRFGNYLSYTKDWAAPEQLIPYDYHSISEKTDIYALGELVFWSVFGRHSLDREHRRSSRFSFENIDELKNPELQRMFTDFFHITIRPSVKNRADSMDVVIDMLSRIITELDKECFIVPSCINANRIFLGRENEIKRIDEELSKNHILFLSGIGGIGKSELAKNYAKSSGMSCCYISYEGSLIDSIINCLKIVDFQRFSEESDEAYCIRKLNKLNSEGKGFLVIIDNMNTRMSELSEADKKAWTELIACPCKILVTTRCKDNVFQELKIKEINDDEELIHIFNQYYANKYANDEECYVTAIINHIQKHTLLIELIANQAREEGRSPKSMYNYLAAQGIMNLGTSHVTLIKDDDISNNTVREFIKALYDTSAISKERKILLAELVLMPNCGISQQDFCEFFILTDNSDIKYLKDTGWLNKSNGVLSIHPIIATIVIEDLLIDTDNSMMKTIINATLDIMDMDPFGIHYQEYIELLDSIALKLMEYKIILLDAIEYIDRYMMLVLDSINKNEQKLKIIDYALSLCENLKLTRDDMSDQIERFYDMKVYFCIKGNKEIDDNLLETCKSHFQLAKQQKNYYWKFIWHFNIIIVSNILGHHSTQKEIFFLLKNEMIKIKKQSISKRGIFYYFKRSLLNIEYYSEMDNVPSFFSKEWNYFALLLRKGFCKTLFSPNNEIMIAIDTALELERSNRNNEAIEKVSSTLDDLAEYNNAITTANYKARLILARLFQNIGEYERSEDAFNLCIKMEKNLSDYSQVLNYETRIGLGFMYCNAYKTKGSDFKYDFDYILKYNRNLVDIFNGIKNSNNGFYIGEALFNIGYLYMINGEFDKAMKAFDDALEKYGEYRKQRGYKQQLRFIHIWDCMAEIEFTTGNINEAVKLMNNVIKASKSVYGRNNRLTANYKKKLYEYKKGK